MPKRHSRAMLISRSISSRPARFSPILALIATLTVSGCSASFSIGRQSDDCAGSGGQCSVAEHEAHQPVVAGDLDARIHDYLLAHPEIVQDAQTALAKRQTEARLAQARKALTTNHDAVYADPTDAVMGNPAGDVTIVEAYDLDCPFCRALSPTLDQLIAEDHGARLVLKEYPILGPGSELAARYALAAIKQGKYAEFHRTVLASKLPEHQLDESKLDGFAATAGLDVTRLKADAADPALTRKIVHNRALVGKLGITGTPGLIIGDQMQSGVMTLDTLKKTVADARARKVVAAQ